MIGMFRTVLFVLVCGAAVAGAAEAQPASPAGDDRPFPTGAQVASLDMAAIASASSYARNALARVEKEAQAREADLAKRAKALDDQRLKLEQGTALLDESALGAARQAFEKSRLDFARSREDAQAAIEALQLDVERELKARLFPVVDAVAREKGVFLVVNAASADFIWVHPDIDISLDVAARLDRAAKAP